MMRKEGDMEFFIPKLEADRAEAEYIDQIKDLEEILAEKNERIKELEAIILRVQNALEEMQDKIRRSLWVVLK